VDFDTGEFSVLAADVADAREILFARENGNHFLPLQVSHTHKTDLLPWDTDVVAERLRRRREGAQRQAAADATADNRDDELASSDGGGAASAEGLGEHTEDASEQSSVDVCDSSSHSSSSSESEADEADAIEEDPPGQTHDASDPGAPVEDAASGLDMSHCHPCGSSVRVTASLLWKG
jgi:hypothetical protein